MQFVTDDGYVLRASREISEEMLRRATSPEILMQRELSVLEDEFNKEAIRWAGTYGGAANEPI